jgi:hypothetical protein
MAVARGPVVVLLICGIGLISAPLATAAPRFSGVTLGSSASGERVARHAFVVGDGYSLRLRDRRSSRTRFRVCLTLRGATLHCQQGRTARRTASGFSSGFTFAVAPPDVGRYVYRWYVANREIAAWRVGD